MILPSSCGFAEWGDVFGGPVVATAFLDRLLHHAVVVASYRLRQHADLVPDHIRSKALIHPPSRHRSSRSRSVAVARVRPGTPPRESPRLSH